MRNTNVNQYELWEDRDGYCMLPADHPQRDVLIAPDAKLLQVFTAETWEDACHQQHKFLGWEPYRPFNDTMTE